jgi:hypothetical protein
VEQGLTDLVEVGLVEGKDGTHNGLDDGFFGEESQV